MRLRDGRPHSNHMDRRDGGSLLLTCTQGPGTEDTPHHASRMECPQEQSEQPGAWAAGSAATTGQDGPWLPQEGLMGLCE